MFHCKRPPFSSRRISTAGWPIARGPRKPSTSPRHLQAWTANRRSSAPRNCAHCSPNWEMRHERMPSTHEAVGVHIRYIVRHINVACQSSSFVPMAILSPCSSPFSTHLPQTVAGLPIIRITRNGSRSSPLQTPGCDAGIRRVC